MRKNKKSILKPVLIILSVVGIMYCLLIFYLINQIKPVNKKNSTLQTIELSSGRIKTIAKELKEQGYQLKAIKMVVHSGANPEEAAALSTAGQPANTSLNHSTSYASAEDKMAQFRVLMSGIVKEALADNNQDLSKEIGENVGDRVLKEMNYLMREQDEQEEERFRKLDAAIRELNVKKLKSGAKKKEPHRLFAKKEVTT